MRAINQKILTVKVEKEDQVLKEKLGGLVIKNTQYDTLKVISVGDQVTGVNEGDTLYVYPNSGTRVTIEGTDYVVVTYPDILMAE